MICHAALYVCIYLLIEWVFVLLEKLARVGCYTLGLQWKNQHIAQ